MKMPSEKETFDELVNKSPKSIVWFTVASTSFFLLILLIILFTVSYPDSIDGNGIITTDPKPIVIYNPKDGIIVDMVKENKTVSKGEVLGRYSDEFAIENIDLLENFEKNLQEFLLNNDTDPNKLLTFNVDLGRLNTYLFKIKHDLSKIAYHRRLQRKYSVNAAVASMKQWNEAQRKLLNSQVSQFNSELDSLKMVQNGMRELHRKGMVGKNEEIQIESEILEIKKSISDIRFSLYKSEIENKGYEKENENLMKIKEEKEEELELSIKNSMSELYNIIEDWKHNNIIISPIDGKIVFLDSWTERQYFRKEEKLFAIIDPSNNLIVDVNVKANNFGKVFKGLKTKVISLNYPKGEYGVIYGSVEKINAVPKNGEYSVNIKIESPIKTSYGKTIPFQPEMPVKVEIITTNRSIASRLLSILNFE